MQISPPHRGWQWRVADGCRVAPPPLRGSDGVPGTNGAFHFNGIGAAVRAHQCVPINTCLKTHYQAVTASSATKPPINTDCRRTQLCCSLTHVDGYNMRKSACRRETPERTPKSPSPQCYDRVTWASGAERPFKRFQTRLYESALSLKRCWESGEPVRGQKHVRHGETIWITERGLGGTSLFRLPGCRLDAVQVILLQQEERRLCFYTELLHKADVEMKAEAEWKKNRSRVSAMVKDANGKPEYLEPCGEHANPTQAERRKLGRESVKLPLCLLGERPIPRQ
ncbi:hypothetical protein D4764_09G0000400, partial [Takifugu flavidus]